MKNIVLVTVDCLRADAVGFYGHTNNITPSLDSIADEAIVFKKCFANASTTAFSFPSIHISQYFQSFVGHRLPGPIPTVAMRMKESGYATGAVISANPNLIPEFGYDQGFQYYADSINPDSEERRDASNHRTPAADSDNNHIPEMYKKIRQSDLLYSHSKRLYELFRYELLNPYRKFRNYSKFLLGGNPNSLSRYICEPAGDIVERGVRWIDSLDNLDSPFFLWLHFMDPHAWYGPEQRFLKEVGGEDISRLQQFRANRSLMSASPFKSGPNNTGVRSHIDTLRTLYDGSVRQADAGIGDLYKALDERGVLSDTALVITADHGEQFLEHGGVQHGKGIHTELTHVPLIIRDPDVGSSEVSSLVQLLDVSPTLLSIADCDIPKEYFGTDLTKFYHPDSTTDITYRTALSIDIDSGGIIARDGRYSLLKRNGHEKVFDRMDDRHEQYPTDGPENRVQRLNEKIRRYRSRVVEDTPPERAVSSEIEQQLSDLGYK